MTRSEELIHKGLSTNPLRYIFGLISTLTVITLFVLTKKEVIMHHYDFMIVLFLVLAVAFFSIANTVSRAINDLRETDPKDPGLTAKNSTNLENYQKIAKWSSIITYILFFAGVALLPMIANMNELPFKLPEWLIS